MHEREQRDLICSIRPAWLMVKFSLGHDAISNLPHDGDVCA